LALNAVAELAPSFPRSLQKRDATGNRIRGKRRIVT
jgi:hypothetical protein